MPASKRAIADCEVCIRLAMALCEMRERLRIAVRASSNARRWRASSIKEGNSGLRLVAFLDHLVKKILLHANSPFMFPLALLSLAVANLPVFVLLA